MMRLVKEQLNEDGFTRGGDPYKKLGIGDRAHYDNLIKSNMGDQQAFDEAREYAITKSHGFWKAELFKDKFILTDDLYWYEAGPYAFLDGDEARNQYEDEYEDFHIYEKGMEVMVSNFFEYDGTHSCMLSGGPDDFDGSTEAIKKWIKEHEGFSFGEGWTYSGEMYVDDFFSSIRSGDIKKI